MSPAETPTRILLVEDDDATRVLLEDFLRNAGYEIDAATTVAEGCALLNSKIYDLLLTDGRLPNGTGLAVARKANEKGVKVLLLTVYGHQFSQNQPDYITLLEKPIRLGDLLQAIERSLDRGA